MSNDGVAGQEAAPDTPPPSNMRDEAAGALRNAVKLGSSLMATWAIALVVRFYVPRHLGPEQFGVYNAADALAATAFTFLTLGLDTHIQKKIAIAPKSASDFFGTVMIFRLVMSVIIFGIVAYILSIGHRTFEVQRVVFIFGAANVLVIFNQSYAALLQSVQTVGGLSIVNVASKVAWGLGIGVVLATGGGLDALAAAFLVSESGRAIVLHQLARRHLSLRIKWDFTAGKRAVKDSLPYYLNTVAIIAYAKVDVNMMSVLANDVEIGWYGSAANFAGLAMLIAPLIQWVLMPLMARAANRDHEELLALTRRVIEAVIVAAIPISLLMALGADVWVRLVFGPAFTPATMSLRILAPMFVLTYMAMITATVLILLERSWTVTLISVGGLLLNPPMNSIVIPLFARVFGQGGAGMGAATTLVTTELFVTTSFLVVLGKRVLDRRMLVAFAKSLGVCLAVGVTDRMMGSLGPARIAVDAVLYVLLALGVGAVRREDVLAIVRLARSRGDKNAAAA